MAPVPEDRTDVNDARGALRIVLGISLLVLVASWIFATAPFGAPDEADHYLRALGIANGQLVGPRVPWIDPGISPAQQAWASQDSRGVFVPPDRSPSGRLCTTFQPDTAPPGCVEATHTGDYEPLPYLLPALTLKQEVSATTGLWLSRGASGLQCAALILIAAALLWSGSLWSLIGLAIAITPAVLFTGSVVNPDGLEIAASLALTAGVLRVARAPSGVSPFVWAGVAVSGAVAILSWQLGPVFAGLNILLLAGLLGVAGLRELWASARTAILITGVALLASLAVAVIYGIDSGLLHSNVAIGISGLRAGFAQVPQLYPDWIGNFGQQNAHLAPVWYAAYGVLLGALIVAAGALANRRERALLAAVLLVAIAFPALFFGWAYRFTGFGLQARYVVPVLALVPLVAGELLYRRAGSRRPGRWAYAGVAVLVAVQIAAWVTSAAHVTGSAGLSFLSSAAWSPPLGWVPWAAAMATAVLALGAGLLALRTRQPEPAGLGSPGGGKRT